VALETGAFREIIMAKIKLTKTVVEATQPQATAIELRDTIVPGFLCLHSSLNYQSPVVFENNPSKS